MHADKKLSLNYKISMNILKEGMINKNLLTHIFFKVGPLFRSLSACLQRINHASSCCISFLNLFQIGHFLNNDITYRQYSVEDKYVNSSIYVINGQTNS